MVTLNDYGNLEIYLSNVYDIIISGANLDEFKRACLTDEIAEKTGLRGLPNLIIETIRQFLDESNSEVSDNTKLNKLIHEWNENIAPILGVKCNTFDEFAKSVANVAEEWIEYVEIAQEQDVQQQTFVDVNMLLNENNHLRLENKHKDEEINNLKACLAALGQTV